jgi:Holliday junction resolvase RusA-like endonuclease
VYESNRNVAPWRDAIRTETQRAVEVPLEGPVCVRVMFYLKRPKSHFRTGRNARLIRAGAPHYPAAMPDLDKLCRAVLDGLTDGGAWKDDGQVIQLHAEKLYSIGDGTGCVIELHNARA